MEWSGVTNEIFQDCLPPPPIPLETLLNNLSRCTYNYKWRRTARICKQFFGKVCFFSFSSKLLSITQARVGQGKDRYCILNCTDIFSPLQGNFKGKLLQLLSVYWCISFTSSDAIRYNTYHVLIFQRETVNSEINLK